MLDLLHRFFILNLISIIHSIGLDLGFIFIHLIHFIFNLYYALLSYANYKWEIINRDLEHRVQVSMHSLQVNRVKHETLLATDCRIIGAKSSKQQALTAI